MRRRPWRRSDTIVATLLVLAVLTGVGLLIAWDIKRGCLVWGTGYDAGRSGWYSLPVCLK